MCVGGWEGASSAKFIYMIYNLDLFNNKFTFGPLCFGIGKTEKVHFFGTIKLSDIKKH